MIKIGLTGGIGSGKSTVSDYFAKLGVPIIDADKIVHNLSVPKQPAYQQVVAAFGDDILDKHGEIDRIALRSLVFQNKEKRQQLENIMHPLVRKEIENRVASIDNPYCVIAIPLLIETGYDDFVDRILVVDADESLQIERTTKRSSLDRNEIKNIMNAQINREKRLSFADEIIENNGTIKELEQQVERIHQHYLSLVSSQVV